MIFGLATWFCVTFDLLSALGIFAPSFSKESVVIAHI